MTDPTEITNPGAEQFSSAEKIGALIKEAMLNDKNLYFFSPDETTSNKLSAVYDITERAWDMPIKLWDMPESAQGRIIELLSENVLFATMLGHVMSGKPAFMTSYEAFFAVITSQILQHLKFLKQSAKVDWRPDVPAINLLSTSTCWRQDHNGFTHQSPAIISTLLASPNQHVNCLFPVDDVAATAAFNFMMESKNAVNLTTFNKTNEPRWIDKNHADFQLKNGGASIFEFTSEDNPDYIFTAAGDIATKETINAIKILKSDLPELRFRFINIAALTYNAIGTHGNTLSQDTFDDYYTPDKLILANFHGYPRTLHNILGRYARGNRLKVHGFIEEGSTTTPFEMLSKNQASRYHLAIDVAEKEGKTDLVEKYKKILSDNSSHAHKYGIDTIK